VYELLYVRIQRRGRQNPPSNVSMVHLKGLIGGILELSLSSRLELIYVGYFNRAADTAASLLEGQRFSQAQASRPPCADNIANSPRRLDAGALSFLATTTKLDPNSSVDQAADQSGQFDLSNLLDGLPLATLWTNNPEGKTSCARCSRSPTALPR